MSKLYRPFAADPDGMRAGRREPRRVDDERGAVARRGECADHDVGAAAILRERAGIGDMADLDAPRRGEQAGELIAPNPPSQLLAARRRSWFFVKKLLDGV